MANKYNIDKCGHRIRAVTDKFKRETEKINTLNMEELTKRLQTTTDIRNIGRMVSPDQLRHLNTILLHQTTHHEMSIAMCKCSKDLDISIPENIESPDQFHRHILEQIEQKKKTMT